MSKKIFITGANAGLGKESARQFAQNKGTEKIFLGVRNLKKGESAKKELEEATGRKIFEVVEIDVSSIASAKQAAKKLPTPVDTLVLNAGGIGGKTPMAITGDGVTDIVAINILGRVALVEELIKEKKLTGVVVYAGSEVARGAKKFGLSAPELKNYSEEEFKSVLNGTYFKPGTDPMVVYAYVKQLATFWISSIAKKYPEIRFVTVSPGATTGTEAAKEANIMFRFLMLTSVGKALGGVLGLTHDLSVGAKRYVDVAEDDSFKSGRFYASDNKTGAVGKLTDQGKFSSIFYDDLKQKNAHSALNSFVAV